MKTARPLIFLLCLTPFLWQCATQQDMQSVELRMRSVDTRMADLNRNIDHLENRTAQQAAMGTAMDRLETELLRTKSLIDENVHFLENAENENRRRFQVIQQEYEQRHQTLLRDIQQQLTNLGQQNEQKNTLLRSDLTNQITSLQNEIIHLNTRLEQAWASLEELRKAKAAEAAERASASARAAEQARQQATRVSEPRSGEPREIAPERLKREPGAPEESTAAAPAARRSPGNDLYERAYSLFQSKRYKDAYNAFEDFIEKNPGNSLLPNARFWLADSLYNQKEYELAILEYQKVISDYPKDAKAPEALLKQGLSFEQLRDGETAKIIYRKLLNDYPRSEQAKTAQTRLGNL